MKKLIFLILILSSINSIAQKITDLPSATGQGVGGVTIVVQNGITKKIPIDSISATAKKYADSLKAVLVIASNTNAANIATNTTAISSKVNISSLATINGLPINNGGANIVINGAATKPLYRVLTPSGSNVTWNYDTSSTVSIATAGTLNLLITGAVPTGSAGIIVVTQSVTGGDSLKYLGTALGIAKIPNKISMVGFIKLETGYSFSVDTTSLFISSTVPPVGNYSAEAQTLFTAAGTTGDNYKTAVNNAIVALKGIILAAGGTAWSKSIMINGRAGSTLAEQAVNWKTPGTYNYTYNGSIVYNANGTKFDGVDDYINTNLNPSIAFAGIGLSDITMVSVIGQYPSSAINQSTYGVPGPSNILAQPSQAAGYTSYLSEGGIVASNPLGTVGRYINTYTTSNNVRLYRNGAQIGFEVFTPTAAFPNSLLYEGATKFGVDFVQFTQARIDVTQIINSKLTAGEAAAIDAVWAAYESALSR